MELFSVPKEEALSLGAMFSNQLFQDRLVFPTENETVKTLEGIVTEKGIGILIEIETVKLTGNTIIFWMYSYMLGW